MEGGSETRELFEGVQAMLCSDVRAWLAQAQTTYAWAADAGVVLAAPGKLLTPTTLSTRLPAGFWALLPYQVAQYCATSSQDAPRIRCLALACEFLLCALDKFDELEDDDDSDERRILGDGRLLNCSTALYQEALQIFAELDDSADHITESPPRLTSIASEELRRAMSGQHLDLLSEGRSWDGFDPEECIAIIEAKSGSLCRMACRLACAVVGAGASLTALFAEVGTHIGVAAQLENDIHGLQQELSADGSLLLKKTDVLRAKKTLPLVLAYQVTLQKPSPPVDTSEYEGQDQQWPLQAYRDSMQQAWAGALFHRLSAASLVESIEQLRGQAFPPELHAILGTRVDAR